MEEMLKKWGGHLRWGLLLVQDSRSPWAAEGEVFYLAWEQGGGR